MPSDIKVADKKRKYVNETDKRVFTHLHAVEASGYKCDSKVELHRISLMFSRILGHAYKKGMLDEKNFDKFLLDLKSSD